MGMQAIGNILHAHGVMRLKSPAVYLALDSDAPRIVLSGLPRHISNCIYALARLGHSGSTFAAAVETKDVAGFVAGEGQPQDISNTAWALARLRGNSPNFAEAIDRKGVAEYLVKEVRRMRGKAEARKPERREKLVASPFLYLTPFFAPSPAS